MNTRLFFLKHDGWFEVEMAGKLLNMTADELRRCAYAMMDCHNYRNYMITENPHPPAVRQGEDEQHITKNQYPICSSTAIHTTASVTAHCRLKHW